MSEIQFAIRMFVFLHVEVVLQVQRIFQLCSKVGDFLAASNSDLPSRFATKDGINNLQTFVMTMTVSRNVEVKLVFEVDIGSCPADRLRQHQILQISSGS